MPIKAAAAALSSQEAIKTNAVALGGVTLSSLPIVVTTPTLDAIVRHAVLFASFIYTGAKAIRAVIEARAAMRATRRKSRRK